MEKQGRIFIAAFLSEKGRPLAKVSEVGLGTDWHKAVATIINIGFSSRPKETEKSILSSLLVPVRRCKNRVALTRWIAGKEHHSGIGPRRSRLPSTRGQIISGSHHRRLGPGNTGKLS